MTKRVRPPAEKKRLSYERDGRNTYGENDKSSRKAIPLFKARSHRKTRHISTQELTVANVAGEVFDHTETRLNDRLGKHKQMMRRKSADTPLGLTLAIDGKVGMDKAVAKRDAVKAHKRVNRYRLPSSKAGV